MDDATRHPRKENGRVVGPPVLATVKVDPDTIVASGIGSRTHDEKRANDKDEDD